MSTPIVVDVAAGNNRTIRTGSIGCGVLGGFFVLAGVIAALSSDLGTAAFAIVLGLVIAGIGLFPLLNSKVFLRPRQFVVDQAGIRWQDPKGASWALRWSELSAVTISTSGTRSAGVRTFAGLVRVDLHPTGPAVPEAHPEIAHLWEVDDVKDAYRVPLGPNPGLIPQLEHAFRTFAPDGTYRGTVQGDSGLL